jgi:excinuclease ABC subunit C
MEPVYFRENIFPTLPENPGVYEYHDADGKILYVGKAKNLRNRISSYFNQGHSHSARIKLLVKKINKLRFTIVDSEHDALLLENSLIKKFQPKYNVMLKDDKTYPLICIKNERFPKVFLTRNKINDGSEYLGPFTSVNRVRLILDFLRMVYPIRTCTYNLSQKNIEQKKIKVCLEYHIGNCLGPCEGLQSEDDYNDSINQIRNIIKGKATIVIKHFKEKMLEHADKFEFESAELYKKKINLLKKYESTSTIVNPKLDNIDVFGIVTVEDKGFITYFKVINGTIIQTHTLQLKYKLDENQSDLLSYAIVALREKYNSKSKEIILPFEPDFKINDVEITIPKKGDKKKLLDLAIQNSTNYKNRILTKLENRNIKRNRYKLILQQIKDDFRMKELPVHIECFDNSNFQGDQPVASMVVFRNAAPSNKDYRHYNIKTVVGPDDFASMGEVVFRRYQRLLDENQNLPQLILIDGGKGQLNAALKSLRKLGIQNRLTIASIAKKLEEIYFPNDPIPLHINKKSPSLKLLQQIRNEAHRFAISFHRNKRIKNTLKTELVDINGIGPKTTNLLLKEFKSIKKIAETDESELAHIIGKQKAKIIYSYYHA